MPGGKEPDICPKRSQARQSIATMTGFDVQAGISPSNADAANKNQYTTVNLFSLFGPESCRPVDVDEAEEEAPWRGSNADARALAERLARAESLVARHGDEKKTAFNMQILSRFRVLLEGVRE